MYEIKIFHAVIKFFQRARISLYICSQVWNNAESWARSKLLVSWLFQSVMRMGGAICQSPTCALQTQSIWHIVFYHWLQLPSHRIATFSETDLSQQNWWEKSTEICGQSVLTLRYSQSGNCSSANGNSRDKVTK